MCGFIFYGCWNDDEDDSSVRIRVELGGDLSQEHIIIEDHSDVYINGVTRFLSTADSALIVGNDVVFHMSANAEIMFFANPIVSNEDDAPMIKRAQEDAAWSQVTLQGEAPFRFIGWSFQGGNRGLVIDATQVKLESCSFKSMNSYGIYNSSGDSLIITDCDFQRCRTSIYTEDGNLTLMRTNIQGGNEGEIGVFNQRARAHIEDTVITDESIAGLYLTGGSDTEASTWVEYSYFALCNSGVYSESSRPFHFQHNVVENCVYHGLYLRLHITGMPFTISDNHLLDCTIGWPLRYDNGIELDVTNNWWGTDDSLEVSTRIHDGRSNPEVVGIANYTPYALMPFSSVGPR